MEKTAAEVVCGRCSRVIGEVVKMPEDGGEWLKVNHLIVRAAHGTCVCGKEFHYSAGDRALAELVRRTLEMRKKYGMMENK